MTSTATVPRAVSSHCVACGDSHSSRHRSSSASLQSRPVGGSGTGKSVLLRAIVGLDAVRAGTIDVSGAPGARVLARTSATAHPAAQPLAVAVQHGAGRVVVLADSDLVGDDSIAELDHEEFWVNLVTWAGNGGAALRGTPTRNVAPSPQSGLAPQGPWQGGVPHSGAPPFARPPGP